MRDFHAHQLNNKAPITPSIERLKVPALRFADGHDVYYFTGTAVHCPFEPALPFVEPLEYCRTILSLTGLTIGHESYKPQGAPRDAVFNRKEYFKRYCKAPGEEEYLDKDFNKVKSDVIDFTRTANCCFISPNLAHIRSLLNPNADNSKELPFDGIKNMLTKFTTMVNYLSDNVLIQSNNLAAFMLAVMQGKTIE